MVQKVIVEWLIYGIPLKKNSHIYTPQSEHNGWLPKGNVDINPDGKKFQCNATGLVSIQILHLTFNLSLTTAHKMQMSELEASGILQLLLLRLSTTHCRSLRTLPHPGGLQNV